MNIEIKNIIEAYLLEATFDEGINLTEISKEGFIEVQKTTNELHGDYYSNIAMKLSKVLKKNPMDIGEHIKRDLTEKKYPQCKTTVSGKVRPPAVRRQLFSRPAVCRLPVALQVQGGKRGGVPPPVRAM